MKTYSWKLPGVLEGKGQAGGGWLWGRGMVGGLVGRREGRGLMRQRKEAWGASLGAGW